MAWKSSKQSYETNARKMILTSKGKLHLVTEYHPILILSSTLVPPVILASCRGRVNHQAAINECKPLVRQGIKHFIILASLLKPLIACNRRLRKGPVQISGQQAWNGQGQKCTREQSWKVRYEQILDNPCDYLVPYICFEAVCVLYKCSFRVQLQGNLV